jgi:hypothetical protein
MSVRFILRHPGHADPDQADSNLHSYAFFPIKFQYAVQILKIVTPFATYEKGIIVNCQCREEN